MINPAEKELLMSDCDFVFDSSLPVVVFYISYSQSIYWVDTLSFFPLFFFFLQETFKRLFVDCVLFGLQAD